MNDSDRGKLIFIVGCGDIGQRVACLEQAAGHVVAALARSHDAAHALFQRGIKPVEGDLDQPDSLRLLPASPAAIYYFAPPPAQGEGDPRLSGLLAALDGQTLPRRVVYISTSGVYGDCGGAWVNEDWPSHPRSERGRRRAAAESCLREWAGARGVEWVILRVPGIYGPGRLPVERLQRGVPVVRVEESPWSNRIHADDLAQACFLSVRRGRTGGIDNISDGHPSTMTDYFFQVADTLGLRRPPAISMEEARRVLGPGILSFMEESKRLDNTRMLADLDMALRYPDIARGLVACLQPHAVEDGLG
jgi:nucleoside-diphosphate-sugar epimerase